MSVSTQTHRHYMYMIIYISIRFKGFPFESHPNKKIEMRSLCFMKLLKIKKIKKRKKKEKKKLDMNSTLSLREGIYAGYQ